MKRMIIALLAVILVISLAACGENKNSQSSSNGTSSSAAENTSEKPSIAGTWENEYGEVFIFNDDGTGTTYKQSQATPGKKIAEEVVFYELLDNNRMTLYRGENKRVHNTFPYSVTDTSLNFKYDNIDHIYYRK